MVGVIIAFPYIATRLGDLGTEGSSSYYRIVGPLVMVGYSLTHIDGVVRFGSLYEYVASFGIFNGADVGKTIDNGLYLLIIYFLVRSANDAVVYGESFKMALNAFGDNRNFRVQLYLFTPVSLFLPVQYLARNMLFNRLSVHFAQGVKNFITGGCMFLSVVTVAFRNYEGW